MITYFKKENDVFAPADTLTTGGWINVIQPDEAERTYLLEKIGLPVSFYNDIMDSDERPRVETELGWELYIVRVPVRSESEKQPFSTVPLGILFHEQYCVTICAEKAELMEDFVRYSWRKHITVKGNPEFVLRMLLSSSVWYMKYLKQINLLIKRAEANLEKSVRNEDLHTMMHLEKCLVYFMTSLKGNYSLFLRLQNSRLNPLDDLADLLEDVSIELKQAQEMAEIYGNILNGMMDAYASVISNNLNVVMKRLTSISLLLMIPTLIASFYGMNVPNGLENTPHGSLIVVIISVLFSAAGIWLFRKKNWY